MIDLIFDGFIFGIAAGLGATVVAVLGLIIHTIWWGYRRWF